MSSKSSYHGEEKVECWLEPEPLSMRELHDDVEGGVEHHVGDEHCEEVGGKVQGDDRAGSGQNPLGRQAPVGSVHHQQEDQPVRVQGTQTTEITTQQGPAIVAAYHPNPLASVAVQLESEM